MGTTQFMAVPYALQAKEASNVFSGNYDDLVNTPTIIEPTGLEQITENGNSGWRLLGREPENYGDIGYGALDLSYNINPSITLWSNWWDFFGNWNIYNSLRGSFHSLGKIN